MSERRKKTVTLHQHFPVPQSIRPRPRLSSPTFFRRFGILIPRNLPHPIRRIHHVRFDWSPHTCVTSDRYIDFENAVTIKGGTQEYYSNQNHHQQDCLSLFRPCNAHFQAGGSSCTPRTKMKRVKARTQ